MCSSHSDSFTDKLQYEVTNRAFTRVSMARAVTKPGPPNSLAFWRAYRDLELLSQRKYQPIVDKYKLEPQAFIVTLKVHTTELLFDLFPEKMLGGLTEATTDYVGQLRTLRDLAPAEDRAFCEYAVAQEQAQADALKHAVTGQLDLGTAVLRRFVEENR
jgi:hypothetical protein